MVIYLIINNQIYLILAIVTSCYENKEEKVQLPFARKIKEIVTKYSVFSNLWSSDQLE